MTLESNISASVRCRASKSRNAPMAPGMDQNGSNVERTVVPMSRDDWRAWLSENVGSLDAGDLETTES